MTAYTTEVLTAKHVVLFAINILQPCDKGTLQTNLGRHVAPHLLDDLLSQLLEEKRATREGDYFRLTLRGMESIVPGEGRILRDLQRMEYLFQLTKKGGGA